ncbi:hypothetical protein CR205_07830 [Alteribacter lacisalsi]|uniref:DUF309 domain-containing protein n=1 Tax=Alteribacter lacisalsi TaxID=2045244 RepID=A0A2W0HBD6_9BACI|nr:DUF309 domain-containing protein [Alteribacter lacisalsi]PYZ98487.1 hypothetical protein CR205_07830 [Alteribacter lacisalsi]
MQYPEEYKEYLVYFQAERDLFECHEVMEEKWKEDRQDHWLALIQLAVSLYHHRQGNFPGAVRLLKKVIVTAEQKPAVFRSLGIDTDKWLNLMRERLAVLKKREGYTSFNLPFSDAGLEQDLMSKSRKEGFLWGEPETADNKNLVYKHKLRDRSDVIEARRKSLIKKRKEREAN